jgi:hypothetical protein
LGLWWTIDAISIITALSAFFYNQVVSAYSYWFFVLDCIMWGLVLVSVASPFSCLSKRPQPSTGGQSKLHSPVPSSSSSSATIDQIMLQTPDLDLDKDPVQSSTMWKRCLNRVTLMLYWFHRLVLLNAAVLFFPAYLVLKTLFFLDWASTFFLVDGYDRTVLLAVQLGSFACFFNLLCFFTSSWLLDTIQSTKRMFKKIRIEHTPEETEPLLQ